MKNIMIYIVISVNDENVGHTDRFEFFVFLIRIYLHTLKYGFNFEVCAERFCLYLYHISGLLLTQSC